MFSFPNPSGGYRCKEWAWNEQLCACNKERDGNDAHFAHGKLVMCITTAEAVQDGQPPVK
jgi:hypothetical protein